MNRLERKLLHAFLRTAPWQVRDGREVATVWLEPDAIHQDAFPADIVVVDVLWTHTCPSGLVPVAIAKRP